MKRVFKKIFALLLILPIAAIFVACGSKKTPTPTDEQEPKQKKEIVASGVSLEYTEVEYSGEPLTPSVTVVVDDVVLSASDYAVYYSNNIEIGTATVIVMAATDSNYTGSVSKNFEITKVIITEEDVRLSDTYFEYDGTEKTPSVTISHNNFTLSNELFSITYEDNIDMGAAYVVITCLDDDIYYADLRIQFWITEKQITLEDITIDYSGYVLDGESGAVYYTGEQIKPGVSITHDGVTLVGKIEGEESANQDPESENPEGENPEGSSTNVDYIVSYGTNISDVGYIYIFSADGSDYLIDLTITFQIVKRSINFSGLTESHSESDNSYTYSNENVTCTYYADSKTYSVVIKYDENTTLKEKTESEEGDYNVSIFVDSLNNVNFRVTCTANSFYTFRTINLNFTVTVSDASEGSNEDNDDNGGNEDEEVVKE